MRRLACLFLIILTALLIVSPPRASANVNVWTYHYDNFRTGANTNETILAPSNVNTNTFGRLFTQTVDGFTYAQPLYVANVVITNNTIHNGTHNVVFVATENDTVYAFDADSNAGANSTALWQRSLLGSGESVLTNTDVNTTDIVPTIGITGTPVIDVAAGTLYVVAKSKNGSTFIQRLHALDITSGAERPNSPVVIQCSVPGTGLGTDGLGHVPFNPLTQNQRPGLLLLNGVVYISWASHGDQDPYHGWVLGYNENTLQQVKVYNTNPNGTRAGIWQAGQGPAADTNGNIFFMTGNGTYDGITNNDYGDSILKLSTTNSGTNLVLADYFTPYNQLALGGPGADTDLGSGGAMLLPASVGNGTNLLVGAGKGRTIYLINCTNMGGFHAGSDSQIVQSLIGATAGVVLSSPAYFNNRVYYMSYNDVMKVFQITNGLLSTSPINTGSVKFQQWGISPSISANGTNNAIVWGVRHDSYGIPNTTLGPAVLYAFDAYNVATLLYNSSQAGTRDTAGNAVKFTLPTVVNGKVYVGTQTELDVYGNGIFTTKPIIVSQPQSQTVPLGTTVTLNVGVYSSNAFNTQWSFDGAAISGATATNYVIPNVQLANAGNYSVLISNAQGTATSALAYLSVVAPLTNSPGAVLAPPGMVDWWPADGNAIDIFGGNNGTPQNGFTYVPGESGLAFHFNGTTNQLNLGAANILPPWTACMWVNRQNAPGTAAVILADNTYSLKLEQDQSGANSREVGITHLGVTDWVFSPAYIVPTGTWTHLAFVANSTTVSLYVNGAFQGSIAVSNFPLPRTYFGTWFPASKYTDYMLGSLDEIMLFNTALTGPQISAIYNAGSAGVVRAPQFTSIAKANGKIPLGLSGQTGKTFTLFTSTNLTTWQQLITLPNPTGAILYTNSISNQLQFYRATQP